MTVGAPPGDGDAGLGSIARETERMLDTKEGLKKLVISAVESNGDAFQALIRNPTLPETGMSDLAIKNLLGCMALIDHNNHPGRRVRPCAAQSSPSLLCR
jgi:hypothetical protein